MKISHRQLESIRADPKNFKSILEEFKGGFFRLSKYTCWKHAINFYFKSGYDLNKTENYFIKMFEKNFVDNKRNQRELKNYLEELNRYVNDFNDLGNDIIDTKVNVSLDIGNDNILSGEVHRIDLSLKGGYEVFTIIKGDYNWEDELRFPLLQHFFSGELGCSYDEISVGVYCFEMGEHVVKKYSQNEIEKALKEVNNISGYLI